MGAPVLINGTRYNSTLATLGEGDLQLVRAADVAADAGGTAASYRDSAVVLIVSKIESLVQSAERFNEAYAASSFCPTSADGLQAGSDCKEMVTA